MLSEQHLYTQRDHLFTTLNLQNAQALSLDIYIMISNRSFWLYSALLWCDSLMWLVCFYAVLFLFGKKLRAD